MAITLPNTTVVTVFGGSGFLGRYAVQALARAGARVKVAVRRPDLAGHLQPLGAPGQIMAVQANIRDEASVAMAVRDADAVVNLVGILAPTGKQTFDAVQSNGPGRLAAAAAAAGAGTFVHISAIGADRNAVSAYARTKGEGEARVFAAFPPAAVLRPSLVFGPEDQFFNRFASLARFSPVLPLIGGRTKFQPVYAGDVAQAILAAVAGRAAHGAVYELGGPTVYTFRELLMKVNAWSGRARPLLPIPFWVAKLQGLVLQALPGALLTVDQVRLLERDNVVGPDAIRDARTLQGLGIAEPSAIETIVPAYLKRFTPHGEFSTVPGKNS